MRINVREVKCIKATSVTTFLVSTTLTKARFVPRELYTVLSYNPLKHWQISLLKSSKAAMVLLCFFICFHLFFNFKGRMSKVFVQFWASGSVKRSDQG